MRFPWQEPPYSDEEYMDTYRDDWYRPWSGFARVVMMAFVVSVALLTRRPVGPVVWALIAAGVWASLSYLARVLRSPTKVRFEGDNLRIWFPFGREEVWQRDELQVLRYRQLLVLRRGHRRRTPRWFDRAYILADRPTNRRLQDHLEQWYGADRIEVRRP